MQRPWRAIVRTIRAHPRPSAFNGLVICLCLVALVLALIQDGPRVYVVGEQDDYVIVLDIGHGGRDPGAVVENVRLRDGSKASLYEHGLVFDVGARLLRLLEAHEDIAVLPLLTDEDGELPPSDLSVPLPPARSYLRTTPRCDLREASSTVAVNLRWMLANHLQEQLRSEASHVNRRVIFVSLHMDEVPSRAGGLTVYTPPGASEFVHPENQQAYMPYFEAREWFRRSALPEESSWDVSLSNELARRIVESFRRHNLKICTEQTYRTRIQRARQPLYPPAVIKYNTVETRVLLELANLADLEDQQRVIDPQYRERMAWAIYEAIMAVLKSDENGAGMSLFSARAGR